MATETVALPVGEAVRGCTLRFMQLSARIMGELIQAGNTPHVSLDIAAASAISACLSLLAQGGASDPELSDYLRNIAKEVDEGRFASDPSQEAE